MDGPEFTNQNLCVPSWHDVLQFGTFLSVAYSDSHRISAEGSSLIPINSFSLCVFFLIHSTLRLSDSKSPQVFRTLLSILAVLNSPVVWMVSTRSPTSKSSRPFNNPLVTVPKAPITIGIIVTFMSHSFFNSLTRSRYLSVFSHSFSFILWSAGTAMSTILQIFFFFCWLL